MAQGDAAVPLSDAVGVGAARVPAESGGRRRGRMMVAAGRHQREAAKTGNECLSGHVRPLKEDPDDEGDPGWKDALDRLAVASGLN
jgi:hypothetical protein